MGKAISADNLRVHLAYEIHWLVFAATQFMNAFSGNKVAAIYQDSALLHARNLLEFTRSKERSTHGWWIAEVGGLTPQDNVSHKDWVRFINAKVTHLGEGRLQDRFLPVAKSEHYLISLAQELLKRISDNLPEESSDERVNVMKNLVELGQQYLGSPTEENLRAIAQAIDKPLPSQAKANKLSLFNKAP